jgi:hypothetical protein
MVSIIQHMNFPDAAPLVLICDLRADKLASIPLLASGRSEVSVIGTLAGLTIF